jgi:hypothetical protein
LSDRSWIQAIQRLALRSLASALTRSANGFGSPIGIHYAARAAELSASTSSLRSQVIACSSLIEYPPMQASGDLKAKIEQAIAASKAQGE